MSAYSKETIADGSGREALVVIDPATLEELDRVPLMTPEEVTQQVEHAENTFPMWRELPIEERARFILRARDYLLDHVDEVARTITREMGKPQIESLVADIMVTADLMGHFALKAPEILEERNIPIHLFKVVRQSFVRYEPLGVVSVISPYNYPFSIPMSSIVFALLAGNTVVFKAASDAVLVAKKIEEIFREGGRLPEGVLNLVTASGSSIGTTLYEPPVAKVTFTGSTETGVSIMRDAAKHLIPVTLELGGKDPMIVLPDADLERAANGAVWGSYCNAGQTCASVERLYVHRSIHDEFVKILKSKVESLRVGLGTDPDVDVGPLINERQRETVEAHVADATEKGAQVVVGGRRPVELKGYFYEPTLLTNVNHEMRCMREETFGPTLPVMAFDTEEEAIALANDSEFGLTASVWSANRDRAERIASRLEAGTVSINDHISSFGLPETPWQGVKQSGLGISHSDEGLKAFTHPKHIAVDRIPLTQSPWWFPYSQLKQDAFKSGIQAVLGGRGIESVFEGLRNFLGSAGSGGELNTRTWQTVRDRLTGSNGECREETPPEGLWQSLLWATTPCDPEAPKPIQR